MTDNQSPEDEPTIEADRDIPSVASRSGGRTLGATFFGLVVVAAIGMLVMDGAKPEPETNLVEADPEEFRYSRNGAGQPYLQPASLETTQQPEPQQLAGAPTYDDAELRARIEQLRLAALEQQLSDAEELQLRIKSPQLIVDIAGTSANVSNSPRAQNASQGLSFTAEQLTQLGAGVQPQSSALPADSNRALLNQAQDQTFTVSHATQLTNLESLVPQGSMIPAVLETAISTDVFGQIRAITSVDVWSMDQSKVLIPRGTRLIGEYNADVSRGQNRVFIVWNRLIRSDGASIQLASGGTDTLGRAGLRGDVDTHFWERFGAAILLTLVDGAIEAGVEAIDDESNGTFDFGGGRNGLNQAIAATIEQNVNVTPTIHVNQGERVNVFLARDLDFSTVEN